MIQAFCHFNLTYSLWKKINFKFEKIKIKYYVDPAYLSLVWCSDTPAVLLLYLIDQITQTTWGRQRIYHLVRKENEKQAS